MDRTDNYSLLLLAGGKSSRMGKDKAQLLYENKTFIENLVDKAKQLGIVQIYLSRHQENKEGIHLVSDIYPEKGPLGGIHACMKKMSTPYCLILPVDVPQIPVGVLEELLAAHKKQCQHAELRKLPLLIEREDFMEPLIGIYPLEMLGFIEERILEEKLSVFQMLKAWGNKSFQVDIPKWQIANINTKDDYEMLLNMK